MQYNLIDCDISTQPGVAVSATVLI